MANLEKAKAFKRANNYTQSLRCSDLAVTKLKQLKDLPSDDIAEAMAYKHSALTMMGRHREALECAKEWYCMYLTKHTHPAAIRAGFCVIESCMHNEEFFDAVLYASTTWETLTLNQDSHIPDRQRESFIAQGAHSLAKAIFASARSGGMSAEERQAAGQEAITLARRALEIYTQLIGFESKPAAEVMGLLASVLDYFNNVDDDEVLYLLEQAKAIFARQQGSLSPNVATAEKNLGVTYYERAKRARRAHAANDQDRELANLELALSHFREAARINRAINRVDRAEEIARGVSEMEKRLRQIRIINAAAETRG